jgi:hypothetical protein
MLTAIDQRALDIDLATQAAHFQESKVAREILLAETQGAMTYALRMIGSILTYWFPVEQDVRRLQCWLVPACVEDDLQRRFAGYLPGSGDWIL